MYNAEKMIEMMSPAKAFEAISQAKLFDVAAQTKLVESTMDQFYGLADAYQTQTRKAVEVWLDQSEAALEESQKLVKSWMSAMIKTNSEIASDVQATVKETAKVFDLPKTAKKA